MKKSIIVTIMFCLSLFIVAGASADSAHVYGEDSIGIVYNHGDNNDGGYAVGTTHNTYNATAYGANQATALGGSASKGKVTGNSGGIFGDHIGLSYSNSKVKSVAGTTTSPHGRNHSMVSGYAGQGNWADAEAGPGTWAVGGNQSNAAYKGHDVGHHSSGLKGNAATSGGTITGAYSTGDFSIAGGLTANQAKSNLYSADRGRTTVKGSGEVTSATYATDTNGTNGGSAATYATSDFKYNASGPHHAEGGGIAGNAGISKVTVTPNNVKATSASGGFAHSQSSGY